MGPVLVIIASLASACLVVIVAIIWQATRLFSTRTSVAARPPRRARSQPPLPGRQAVAQREFAMIDGTAQARAHLLSDFPSAVAAAAPLSPSVAHLPASAQGFGSGMGNAASGDLPAAEMHTGPVLREPGSPEMSPASAPSAAPPPSPHDTALADLLAAGPWARAFNEGIALRYDTEADIVELRLRACVIRTPAHVEAAYRVAFIRLREFLNTLGRERVALVVDIAGLEVGADVTQPWGKAVRALLDSVCAQYAPGKFLIARYNSRASGGDDRLETVTRIQIITAAVAEGFQSNIVGSREEAFAMVKGLRELVPLREV